MRVDIKILGFKLEDPKIQSNFTCWYQLGDLYTFIALHNSFGLIGFIFHPFELARYVNCICVIQSLSPL